MDPSLLRAEVVDDERRRHACFVGDGPEWRGNAVVGEAQQRGVGDLVLAAGALAAVKSLDTIVR